MSAFPASTRFNASAVTANRLFLSVCVFAISAFASAHAIAQDDPAAMIGKWDSQFAALKEVIGKLRNSPNSLEFGDLKKQYDEKLNEVQATRLLIEPELIKAATPEGELDKKLVNAMNDLAQIALSEDSYDRAYRLLKPLVDHKVEDKMVYQFALMAAYGSDHFDAATQLLAKIKADGDRVEVSFMQDAVMKLPQMVENWTAEQVIRKAESEKNDLPQVKLETTAGDIVIQLYEDQAPNAVANFVNLIEKGYYDGLTFHRVLPQFMAQGGCPKGTGSGGPGYEIDCECYRADYRKHFSGTLSMAHAGRNTGGSQFFLTFLATPHLDGKHTAFGRIIQGMDVLAQINKVNPGSRGADPSPSKIIKGSVVKKRDHKYEPVTHASRR